MANEHIGRKQAIGLGVESTSGTAVAATNWIPKMTGQFKPVYTKAKDDSAYGVIDEVYDSQVVQSMTEVELEGIARDKYIGLFLKLGLGTNLLCKIITISGQSGGTPARGDVVTSATDTWAGVIRKIITRAATTYYIVSTTSGTLTSSGTDLTNGTWTGGTWAVSANAHAHFFSRLNTNAHPSATVYGSDPIGDDRAAYCMLDTLDIEASVGEYVKLSAMLKGKKLESTSAQSPSYTAENPFLAKHAALYLATTESGLNAASAVAVQRLKLSISKNLKEIQDLGTDDISSFHNQQFTVAGDLDAIYNANTLRDYVKDGTKRAARIEIINDEVSTLATNLYPQLVIDFARVSFEEWDRSGENNDIVTQTMGYSAEFDVTTAMAMEVVLINGQATAY